jgi:hypothetical protein
MRRGLSLLWVFNGAARFALFLLCAPQCIVDSAHR